MNNYQNILVVAAHPDDEILGLGATIKRLTDEGCTANVIILGEGLTSRKDSRTDTSNDELIQLKNQSTSAAKKVGYTNVEFSGLPDNRFDSIDLLDIIKIIQKYVDKYRPDTIFTHHYGDLNIDHRITFEAVITACRPVNNNCVKNILCFETPSSTEWNFKYGDSSFKPNIFYDVSNTLDFKLKSMECYLTESTQYPHPRSKEALTAIANKWGTVVGANSAEAFEIIRCVIDDIYFRHANINDIELLFNWVNDDDVRKSAFNSNPISFYEHEKWFNNCLNDKSIEIFIFSIGNNPIGQIRLNYSENSAEIDYSVDKLYRGHGFGKRIVSIIEREVIENHPEILQIIAKVKPDNIASQRVFEYSNYSLISKDTSMIIYVKNLKYTMMPSNPNSVYIKGGGEEVLIHNDNKFIVISHPYFNSSNIDFCSSIEFASAGQ